MPHGRAAVVEIMLHPFAAYRELARAPRDAGWREALAGPAFLSLVLACCLSLTTSTRLTLRLLPSAFVLWSFPALLQTLATCAIARGMAPARLPLRRVVVLYWLGVGPWAVWLIVLAGVFAFAPVERGGVLGSALVPLAWSGVIRVGFLRALALRGRALAGAFALHVALTWGVVVLFFLASGQLIPRLLWALHSSHSS